MSGVGESGMGPCGSQNDRRARNSQLTAVSLSPAFPSTLMSLLPLPDDILPFLEGTAQKFPLPRETCLFPRLSPWATLSGSVQSPGNTCPDPRGVSGANLLSS